MQPTFGPLEVAIGVLGLRDKSEVRTKVTGKDLLWLPHHVGILLRFFGGVPLLRYREIQQRVTGQVTWRLRGAVLPARDGRRSAEFEKSYSVAGGRAWRSAGGAVGSSAMSVHLELHSGEGARRVPAAELRFSALASTLRS